MVISMMLETLGVGLIIPTISLLTLNDIGARFPALQPWYDMLGNPSRESLVIGVLLALVCVFTIKNLYFAFLVWFQERFTLNVHIRLSQHLFELYLRQPYTFHLQRNSAQLIRNISGEVGMFTAFGITNPSWYCRVWPHSVIFLRVIRRKTQLEHPIIDPAIKAPNG